ncbi:ATP-binding protein [Acidithiobacillus ferridurans]|uniref:Uncharacterized protein n=1 Tax=Acidithiobacillus ferridurans TaxID=1232575 RepID=A0A8X8KBI8_ACIFI|nr:ATP-binding protein [Acidithiobacillus ferridurans]MBU2714604.1 hypothetical protein [Acidithiobacillus ferridurans]MBU2723877.1 hypothetical protein [Acidithiobacillus ferridurans]MBU2726327.1 hypothetical protein [Acidithiobacillus ferridurans]
MPEQNAVETLEFTVDPAIIHHTIQSQAGTLGKAIIELVQNAVDAGADRCDIRIDQDTFVVQDNGKGFASRAEVKNYFAKFGTPHKEGDATFGRFRIGRGQIMTFAATRWLSSVFSMDVDIKKKGLRFDLTDTNPEMPGCRIEGRWYEALYPKAIEDEEDGYFARIDPEPDPHAALILELKNSLRYVRIAAFLNGERISMDCGSEKWTMENEDAYFRLKASGSLAIYNQGVLVREDPGYLFGCGGIVVTKKNILLNVSRTEILRTQCPVWPAIEKEIRREGRKFRATKAGATRMDENSRKHAALELMMGQGSFETPVLTLLPRKHVNMHYLASRSDKPLLMAPEDDLVRAEKIARSGMAHVLHPSVMERFGAGTAEQLSQILKTAWLAEGNDRLFFERILPRYSIPEGKAILERRRERLINSAGIWEFADYEQAASAFNGDHTIIEAGELLKDEQVIYRAVENALDSFIRRVRRIHEDNNTGHLSLQIGRSASSEAWTDGKTYLAISEALLRGVVEDGFPGILHLLDVVVHELSHRDCGETQDVPHDEAFYALFHDTTMRSGAAKSDAIDAIIGAYLGICRRDKLKPYRWAQKWLPKRVPS